MYKLVFLLLMSMAFSGPAGPPCAVYLTEQEFIDNRPSKTGKRISCATIFEKEACRLADDVHGFTFSGSNAWGYRTGTTDYRFSRGLGHAIATRGEIWMYSGQADDIYISADTVIYHKRSNAFPLVSKGFRGQLKVVRTLKDLSEFTPGLSLAEMKKLIKARKLTSFLEDVADYYNSTRPGYGGKRFTEFKYVPREHY